MNITLDYLQQDGLLLKGLYIPLDEDEERGVHIGIYGKQHFASVKEFAVMVAQISAITQEWYHYGALEEAFKWYEEHRDSGTHSRLSALKQRAEGSLRDWMEQLGAGIDVEQVPSEIAGKLYFDGNAEEFELIADCPDCYAEVYLADSV